VEEVYLVYYSDKKRTQWLAAFRAAFATAPDVATARSDNSNFIRKLPETNFTIDEKLTNHSNWILSPAKLAGPPSMSQPKLISDAESRALLDKCKELPKVDYVKKISPKSDAAKPDGYIVVCDGKTGKVYKPNLLAGDPEKDRKAGNKIIGPLDRASLIHFVDELGRSMDVEKQMRRKNLPEQNRKLVRDAKQFYERDPEVCLTQEFLPDPKPEPAPVKAGGASFSARRPYQQASLHDVVVASYSFVKAQEAARMRTAGNTEVEAEIPLTHGKMLGRALRRAAAKQRYH
jgi:hypothetical protein